MLESVNEWLNLIINILRLITVPALGKDEWEIWEIMAGDDHN